jgi:hypothetical protein
MHQRICIAIGKIRQDVGTLLSPSAIDQICRSIGHVWRECTLTPSTIIHVFILQVLHGNTALANLRHLTKLDLSGQAFCEARKRLPLEVFRRLLRQIVPRLRDGQEPPALWLGRHRTFGIDGSNFSMPDTPELQREFGQPGNQRPGCGFPVAHFLAMFDSATGFLMDILAFPLRTTDFSKVAQIHPGLRAGDVLVGDRGFCSFVHVAQLAGRGIYCVFRLHQRLVVTAGGLCGPTPATPAKGKKRKPSKRSLAKVLRQLGVRDQVFQWCRPKCPPDWMIDEEFRALPLTLECRVLSYEVNRPGFRTRRIDLLTTLLDAEVYPVKELAELYFRRWQVEIEFRHLKITMNMDVLHCKTVDGVLKELMVFAIVYNLVRVVIVQAARRQDTDVDRISFIDALRWLITAGPRETLRDLIVNPIRRDRVEPRVKKRRMKQFELMSLPRSVLRNRLLAQALVA